MKTGSFNVARKAIIGSLFACGLVAFASPGTAQPVDNPGAEAIVCLWEGLDDEARSSVRGSVRRYMDNETSEIAPGVSVRLTGQSEILGAALTPPLLAACGVPDDEAALVLAVTGVAMRAQAEQARGQLAALGGEPEAIEAAFNRMPGFRREELAVWVWSLNRTEQSDQTINGFWRAIERTRVNRTFQQQRHMAFGLIARLAEHRAATCLSQDQAGREACVEARLGTRE